MKRRSSGASRTVRPGRPAAGDRAGTVDAILHPHGTACAAIAGSVVSGNTRYVSGSKDSNRIGFTASRVARADGPERLL